ncbi:MAG TPA: 23S rRNA (uracil(1939)-C(5))-methyltransferase RlmD [Nitrospiria bacterium]|nr:23S rRNA (uracil(1939)-C(5))-methyltransferase RlmD [Nitrospiria bacterium]
MEGQSIIDATIDKLVDGGMGLARIEGQVVFIPGVCPGERVRARVTAVKSGYAEATLEAVMAPSADRIEPPCPVAGRCGGCQWQHLAYPAQLRTKIDILREDLQRIGKLTDPPLLPPIGAPSPYEYRTRIQLKFDCSHREPFIGFYEAQSRRLVPIDRCLVAAPPLNHAIAALRPLLADPATRLPSLEEAHLHLAPGTGELQCRYVTKGEPKKRVESFLAAAEKRVEGLVSQVYYDRSGHRRVWGRDWVVDRIKDRPFRISDRSFAQVNPEQNEALIDTVTAFASLTGRESVLELYCGIGNFGLFLAPDAKSLYGIDENKSAISDARENASTQGIANVRFTARPVEETVEELAQGAQRWNLIVADPPREGLGRRVTDALVTLKPTRMIYISCVPATLARDLTHLSAGGYRVARIQPVDLFPQTPYLETVTELIVS